MKLINRVCLFRLEPCHNDKGVFISITAFLFMILFHGQFSTKEFVCMLFMFPLSNQEQTFSVINDLCLPIKGETRDINRPHGLREK